MPWELLVVGISTFLDSLPLILPLLLLMYLPPFMFYSCTIDISTAVSLLRTHAARPISCHAGSLCVRLSLHCVPLSSIAVEGGALAPRLACASSASVRRRSLAPHASFVRVVLFDIRCPKAFGVGMRSYRESMVPICARLSCRMLQAGPRRPPMAAIGQSGQCRRIPD